MGKHFVGLHTLLYLRIEALSESTLKIDLTENQKDFLDEATTFNIKVRYPDYKDDFRRKATREFTEKYFNRITEFRLWLKGMITRQ
jgi:hypothetical protein